MDEGSLLKSGASYRGLVHSTLMERHGFESRSTTTTTEWKHMAKMTKREKQDARALAERVAESSRARDYLILAQMSSEGRYVKMQGKVYITPKSQTLDTEG